jgi:hypothetical protein
MPKITNCRATDGPIICEHKAIMEGYCEEHYKQYYNALLLHKKALQMKEEEQKEEQKKKAEEQNKAFDEQYKVLKEEFERDYKMIAGNFIKIIGDEEIHYSSQRLKDTLENKYIETEDEKGKKSKIKFFKLWLEDKDRQCYDKMDFYPSTECPKNIYNKFDGLRASKLNFEMSEAEINKTVEPLITHLNLLTSGHSEYMLKWLANIVQNPDRKSEIAPLLRDQGTLTTCGGGTGKNLFFEFFGAQILGEKYFITVGNNKDLYDNFNGLFENKLLVFVEEAKSDDNSKNIDYLKSMITGKKSKTERKNAEAYNTKNFTNYIFTSNNRNPIQINKNDRRFCVFDVDISKRDNTEYFENLVSHIQKDTTAYAFYKYLMNLKTYENPVQFAHNMPKTDALIEIKILNSGPLIRWIIHCLKRGKMRDDTTSNLYKLYINWTQENREGSQEKPLSLTAFGTQLINDKDIGSITGSGQKRKTHGVMFYTWNNEKLVSNLQALDYLPKSFKFDEEVKDSIEDKIKESEILGTNI